MNRATVLVLLGGLALTAAFMLAPKKPVTEGHPFTPRADSEVVERLTP